MNDASVSLRERGGLSRNRSVLTNGSPGLVISNRSENTSIIGPLPVMEKSWWMSALGISSRMAGSGYSGTSRRIP